MKRFSLAALLACCAVAVALVGCSGGAKSTDEDSLKGFWVIDPASATGFEATLNLEDENFAELVLGDAYLEGEWKAEGSSASITFDEESKSANIYVSGDKLVLGNDDASKIVFVKSDIDEYYADDDDSGDLVELDGDGEAEFEDMEIVDEVIEDITPVKVADDDVCKIEVTGKGTDFTADPGYRLAITNKTDKVIYVVAEDAFKVNGAAIEAGIGEVVDAGETVDTFMYFSADELGGGIDKLTKVEGTLIVGDDETSDDLGKYAFKMD